MITVKIALATHNILLKEFGGGPGIRDLNGLEAAIARPYATFDLQELYPSGIEKASAILESIIINHPFIDGNKRTAYSLMQLILIDHHFVIRVAEDEQYNFVISASTGNSLLRNQSLARI